MNVMRSFKTLIIVLSIALTALNSCIKDEIVLEDPWDFNRPLNLAAPVFNAHFKAKDIIERLGDNDYVYVDDEGVITAQIDTTFEKTYDDIISLDEITFDKKYNIDPALKASKAYFEFYDTIQTNLESDVRLDSSLITSELMQIAVAPPSGFTGDWTISFPGITDKDGNVLSFSGSLDKPETIETTLQEIWIKFVKDGEDISSITMIISVNAYANGIPADTQLSVSIKMLNIVPLKLFGYFGCDTLNVQNGDIDIDLFNDNDLLDAITFKDIRLILVTNNKFGIQAGISLDTVLFSKQSTGEELLLYINDDNTLIVNQAIYDSELDTVYAKTDSLVVNKDNSNLVDAINMDPDKVYYYVSGIVNPDGDQGFENFLINDGKSNLTGELKVQIPFWFKVESYERTDTIDFDIKEIVDSASVDYIDSINLYFDLENGFPINLYSQAYVTDENYNVIDSLFSQEQQVWESPPVDPDGRAQGTTTTEIDVMLDHDKIKKLYDDNAKKILLKTSVSTGNEDNPAFIKLYEDYILNIKMSFDVKSSDNGF